MDNKVTKLSENSFLVAVPVYFSVVVDESGHARSVEQINSSRKWVKGRHNKFGVAYGKNPKGLLAIAAEMARRAATSRFQDQPSEPE